MLLSLKYSLNGREHSKKCQNKSMIISVDQINKKVVLLHFPEPKVLNG